MVLFYDKGIPGRQERPEPIKATVDMHTPENKTPPPPPKLRLAAGILRFSLKQKSCSEH